MGAPAAENVTFSAALPVRSVLSPREGQVISLIADGLNSREIGQRLFVAESTVRDYAKAIRAKLGARNRAHAVTIWLHDYPSDSSKVGGDRRMGQWAEREMPERASTRP